MTIVYKENIVRIRIANACASNCMFCLDKSNIQKMNFLPKNQIFKEIEEKFVQGIKNKIVISGGEASLDPNFLKYIKYARQKGYYKIQTITNGLKWSDYNFCKNAVEAGLDEITFSLHGHSPNIHDELTQTPNSFKKIIKAITNFRKYFPHIIVNTDICINQQNVEYAYKIVQLLKKLNVREYDILQIIPFEAARENRDKLLFKDINKHRNAFQLLWKESEDSRVHMWANRIFPYLLEGYENMIQSPEKIKDEVSGEAKNERETDFSSNKMPSCKEELRCQNCYLYRFCNEYNEYLKGKKNTHKGNNFSKLYTSKDIFEINRIYPENTEEFIKNLYDNGKGKEEIYNIPFCIINKNNKFTTYLDYIKENHVENNFHNFVEWFMNEGFRIKSQRCKKCRYNKKCKGVHINLIKKYGFKILQPQ